MKKYFIKMFDYDRHTNLLILENMLATHSPEKAVQLMAHILATQQVWLKRCQELPLIGAIAWPDWKADIFAATIQENYLACTGYINRLEADDFDKTISYQNFKGENFQNDLSDIFIHMINHGTHHRAQIGQLLKLAGLQELPMTDYIFYLRENGL